MRKRILFIMQLPPPVHGAALVNRFIADSRLVQSDYETRVLPLSFVSSIDDIGRFSLKKIALIFPFLFRLIKTLIMYRPDLVYFTIAPKGGAFYRDALFTSVLKLSRSKIVFHLHSRGIQNSIRDNAFKRRIYRFVYRRAHVICLAPELASEFSDLPLAELFILANGIPEMPIGYGENKSSPTQILFLSNLMVAKGIHLFMEMISRLADRGQEFNAAIVGMDADVKALELERIVKEKKLSDLVNVLGPKFGDEKNKILEASSIFVMPSLDEAFPLTILEAMQAGAVVVASRVGAIPSMIADGQNGFLCEPADVDGFLEKIEVLLHHPERRKAMAMQAKKDFHDKYTLEVFEQNLKKIIDHLCSNAR